LKSLKTKQTELFRFEIFEDYHEVKHFISGRHGGCSQPPFNGLNLGFGTDDTPENVLENRYILAESIGTPLDWFVFPRQTHTANIAVVDIKNRGIGSKTRESAINNTDALITNQKNILITVQVADCVPVLLLDTENGVIAAIHAGWRGTVQEITKKTVLKMADHFRSKPENIIAGIGPSIGSCCYEIGQEVYDSFLAIDSTNSDLFTTKGSSKHLNLWEANKKQLMQLGVTDKNVEIAGLCTQCNHEHFFSSRHGNGNTGRFAAGIMLQ
jgi:YfiH family protein